MIPTAATNSGIVSVEVIEPNAGGNAVQRTTRMKMSQTWLASQTGAIERLMRSRTAMSLPAVRSQMPVPKSAPPSTT